MAIQRAGIGRKLEQPQWLASSRRKGGRRVLFRDRTAQKQRRFCWRSDRVGAAGAAQEVVAAIADGIGSSEGGRVAAKTAVRGFLDGFCERPNVPSEKPSGIIIIATIILMLVTEHVTGIFTS